jgi:hypothetical protein
MHTNQACVCAYAAALRSSGNELAEAYHRTFSKGQRMTPLGVLQRLFPILEIIVSGHTAHTASTQPPTLTCLAHRVPAPHG